ncbi:MAG: GNAT family N-acetyltransferase [Acidimicrobiales bacterium]
MVPGTIAIFDAELAGDHVTLAALLEVTTIDEWPPAGGEHDAGAVTHFRDAHLVEPSVSGWTVYYVCLEDTLVGSAGFIGPPREGKAEIGYSICQKYRRRGLATGAVSALIERAATAGLHTLTAQTGRSNAASIRVLEHNGFVRDGLDSDRELLFVRDLAPGTKPSRNAR